MKTYLTHPSDNKLTNGVFYSDSDDYKKAIDYKNINEFQSLSHKDLLIYLIPSSLVSTYPFKENKKLSHQNNLAKTRGLIAYSVIVPSNVLYHQSSLADTE